MLFKIKSFFTEGHKRSINAKKQISFSIVFKGMSMAISFIVIPLYLKYLSDDQYGFWLTLNSVIVWFTFFDLGLGNGLRNRFAESIAENNPEKARKYISTAYAILGVISLVMLLFFAAVFPLINFERIFNLAPETVQNIGSVVFLVFAFFCVQFVMQLVKMILQADQRSSWIEIINFLGNVFALVGILILYKYTHENLLLLALCVSGSNLFILLLANFYFFRKDYKIYKPSMQYVNFELGKDLFNLGFRFFVLQSAALVVFMTDNIIITQIAGPEEVPPYNIAYRYFSIVLMFFAIITNPFWSAFTEAYNKKDYQWIRNSIKKMNFVWVGALVVLATMVLLSEWVYHFWLGDELFIPFQLTLLFALWVALSTSISIYANFLSGTGKIQLSMYHAIFVIVLNIPLSIWLGKTMGMGSAGVILATIIGLIPRVIFQPFQYRKIISGKAKGVWNK